MSQRTVAFVPSAFEQYFRLSQEQRRNFEKLHKLILEVLRTPFEGTGKPEPLKHQGGNTWSRRINQKDRLVYRVEESRVLILSCRGHYED